MWVMNKILELLKNNIQINQTLVLSFLLVIWVEFYSLNISYVEILVTFLTVIILDLFFIKINSWKWIFPFSGVNAWFWISFFLRSEDIIIYIFAWLLAIVWKNIFQIGGRHFMNPSNMWVFLTLILFPQFAYINTLQWWNYSWEISISYWISLLLVLILGIFISLRVFKIFQFNYLVDLILPFLLAHSLLFFVIPFYENIYGYVEFFSVSFLIFTFFMITDPKTVPQKSINRILYSISMVFSFYILQFFINESYSLLGSLFVNTLLLPIIWSLETKYIKNKSRDIYIFYLILLLFEIFLMSYLLLHYWQPDLLFDNVCGQLFCK